MATEAIDITQRAKVTGRDVLAAVAEIGQEMAERDEELRDVLFRLAHMVGSLRDAVPTGAGASEQTLELGMQALVQSIDTLVGVDTVAGERVATLSATVDRLAEAMAGVAAKLERIDRRIDDLEVRIAPEAVVDPTGPLAVGDEAEPGVS